MRSPRDSEDMVPITVDELSEQRRFVASVEEGMADAEAGRVHPHSEVVAELKRRYRRPVKAGRK